MNVSDGEKSAFFIGMTVAAAVFIGLEYLPWSYHNIVNIARDACEQDLPRDQHCKIIAVPEETK